MSSVRVLECHTFGVSAGLLMTFFYIVSAIFLLICFGVLFTNIEVLGVGLRVEGEGCRDQGWLFLGLRVQGFQNSGVRVYCGFRF